MIMYFLNIASFYITCYIRIIIIFAVIFIGTFAYFYIRNTFHSSPRLSMF